ncbi:unnamed protein product, partial [marine sediment metagenome]
RMEEGEIFITLPSIYFDIDQEDVLNVDWFDKGCFATFVHQNSATLFSLLYKGGEKSFSEITDFLDVPRKDLPIEDVNKAKIFLRFSSLFFHFT